jgi:glycosyltransferase involved in cell wall biosynthesis
VVVDNAPRDDATQRLVAGLPVRYVREPRPGLDWARNAGIREARHGILAFTDDDVQVDEGWLRAIAGAFADSETMLVTGLIAPAELETAAQLTFEYGYGGMDKGVEPRWRVARSPGDLPAMLGSHHLGAGANMAFRREVFDRLGLFDTALDVGTPARGGGDLDMFYRVLASGGVARYEPKALVWHTHRRDFRALRRQLRDNGRSFGVYLLTRWHDTRRHGTGLRRRAVARYAAGTWLRWMVHRVLRRLQRLDPLPLWLQAEEILGMLQAPWAWRATRRADARLRGRAARARAGSWETVVRRGA